MADGRARHVLLHTERPLFAPRSVVAQVKRNAPKIALRAGIDEDAVETILQEFLEPVTVIPRTLFASHMPKAKALARAAGASRDEDFIALTLALDAALWTYDDDFKRIPGLRRIATADLLAD